MLSSGFPEHNNTTRLYLDVHLIMVAPSPCEHLALSNLFSSCQGPHPCEHLSTVGEDTTNTISVFLILSSSIDHEEHLHLSSI